MSENKKTKEEIRKQEIIKLVMRQTDYSEEKVIEKLKQWDNNYINVLKEYMNPNFQNKIVEKKFVSKNQKIYGEIRNFMDVANRNYLMRKKRDERIQKINQQRYLNFLKQKKEESAKNEKLNTIEEEKNDVTNEPEVINI